MGRWALGRADRHGEGGVSVSIAMDDVDLDRDRRLVQQCQAGQAEAFDELYVIYHHRLVRHCARRLGNHANAEDVAQEAFIRAWRAIGRFEGRRRFYPWLHVIASNACTDVLRRERPTTTLSELAGAAELDDGQGIEDAFTSSIDATVAGKAMQLLNERHRRVLYFREALEWSVQDIAAHEGLEANAIDSLLWRARASLRQKFHQLSKGAAALVATGTTRFLSVRNRLARVVHGFHGSGGVPLPARAVVAAVIVIGAGASSAPLLLAPATHPQPSVGGHSAAYTSTGARPGGVTPGHSATSVARSTHVSAAGASVVSGPGAVAGSVATGRDQPSVVPTGRPSPTVPTGVTSPNGTPGPGLPAVSVAPASVVATAGGAAQTVVGVATGIAGGATSAASGVVKTAVGTTVPAPVVQPVTVGSTGVGITVTLP